ncbi:hypothetical protein QVD17_06486 [Tagetes erecta]|uniref:BHLH domain-containing protein n=1 Tax=Tagetes erecta TaxID=13708 RepID=A0AAD8PC95_TARER|nr:hypothetical protein QVD17_06486 [Tagetes erecta]
MDNSSHMTWLPQLEMEVPGNIMKHQQTCHYSQLVDSFSSESFKGGPNMVTPNHSIHHVATTSSDVHKQQQDPRTTNISLLAPNQSSSPNSTFTISFGNPTSPQQINHNCGRSRLNYHDAVMSEEEATLNELLESIDCTTRSRDTRRNHRQAQEHVLAERKRREKLAERFISLSTLLPGLKKMDKATVLEDATKYIIQLQTRVKELEETQCKGKDTTQELGRVSIAISKFCGGHEDVACSLDDTNYSTNSNNFNPEIKVRISDRKMLVRIYCTKSALIVLKTLEEMERLHITIDCCSVLPFGTAHLITIIAQMSDEMVITAKYLVKCLMSTLTSLD